jgi:hypothetical protein
MSDYDQQPIIPDLPQTLSRLGRKYSGQAPDPNNVLYPALSAASPAARSALQRIDLQRVARGQDPLTATQSALGVTAATRNQAITPNPEPTSFFGAALSNLTDLVRGIPQLPVALVNEARALPELTTLLPAALENSDGGGPLNTLGNVANLPGLRFVPGSFIAGAFGDTYTDPVSGATITPEGVDTLTQNPLFTALDVLPFVSKAAKLSTPYRTAATAIEDQARVLGNPVPRAPRPIPTALRQLGGGVEQVADLRQALTSLPANRTPVRGFGPASLANQTGPVAGPMLRPGPLGRALDVGSDRFATTSLGKYVTDARSPLARAAVERGQHHTSFLTDLKFATRADPLAADIFFNTSKELNDLSNAWGPGRAEELYADWTSGKASDPAHAASYTPDESAYLARFEQGQTAIQSHLLTIGHDTYKQGMVTGDKARRNVPGLLEIDFPHGKEIYDYSTGAAILDGRAGIERSTWFRDKAAQFRSGAPVGSLTDLQAELVGILKDPFLKGPERTQAVRLSLAHAVRSGWDVSDLLSNWDRGANKGPIKRAAFQRAIEDPQFLTRAKWNRPLSSTTITQAAQDLAGYRTDPKAVLLQSHLTAGRWSDALKEIRDLKSRRTFAPAINLDELQFAVRDANFESKLAKRAEEMGGTDKQIAKAATKQSAAEVAAMPARWEDLTRAEARKNLGAFLTNLQSQGKLTAEQTAAGIAAVSDDMVAKVQAIVREADPTLVDTVKVLYNEANKTWQALAIGGLEPRWTHRTTPAQASRMFNPQVFDNPNLTAGQLKQRVWDPRPEERNLAISLQHQAYEVLNSIASKNFADEMADWYGVSGSELWAKYEEPARRAVARNPGKYGSLREAIQSLVDRDYVAYSPDQFMQGKRPKGQQLKGMGSQRQTFVPRTVGTTLERLKPQTLSSLERAMQRPMSVFRTSLLPLSPRWHLYNIVGGAIMLGATMDPRAVMHVVEAYRLARNGGEELGRIESATGKIAMPPSGPLREMQEWFQKKRDPRSQASIAHSVAGGATLGRVFNDIWESKASRATRDRGARIIEGSYDFNQFVDNFYRSMSYLSGQDTALRRGLSNTEAIDAGILAARDALQSWDRLTPVERSGMRVLMPFYSWTSHLFRFVMQYPHDHPVRLAVTARIAETELSDQATGLPSRFQTMFTPFGLDANGTGTAILPDGLNPFKDVTNWALLGGFLLGQQEGNIAAVTSSLNPFISTPLEAAGFDTFRGAPDLYPDLAYNPATGQLSSIPNGNPALALMGNLMPQSEVLLNYAGLNSDFNELWRRDPDAARRQLWGNLGLPSGLVRFGMNVPEETIKGEVARWEEMRATRSRALSSGNLGLLDSYPVLSAYRQQIERLSETGALDQYQPGTNAATAGEVESGRPGLVDYLVG